MRIRTIFSGCMGICLLELNWLRSGVGLVSIIGVDGYNGTQPAVIPKDEALGYSVETVDHGMHVDQDRNVRLRRELSHHPLLLLARAGLHLVETNGISLALSCHLVGTVK